ncbi:MAG: hypothetical protein ACREI7_14045, partial [Myxococcota bacterium]
ASRRRSALTTGSSSGGDGDGRNTIRVASVGHALFALTLIALGILGLWRGQFTPIWTGVPKALPARELLVDLCAVVSLASGLGQLWRRTAALASGVLLGYLAAWFLFFRLPLLFRAPTATVAWWASGETVPWSRRPGSSSLASPLT